MSVARLAVLGGPPEFDHPVPFARPSAPSLDRVMARAAPSYDRGVLTNGPLVRELEEAAAAQLQVSEVVAVSSCTAGLMLTLQALELTGDVVVPSFTFSASAHAIAWNGRRPRFVECDPATFQVDAGEVAGAVEDAAAVLATHVFGAPCRPDAIVAAAGGLPVVFDAAHAFGAVHGPRPIGGFGVAEVFSLSPTKLVVAGEGGLVATHDPTLAARLRIARDYGNPGDYDTQFAGLNARMSELHAATALESLADLDAALARRRDLADRYLAGLDGVPGVAAQSVDASDRSTFKDFTIAIDADRFGAGRDAVVAALAAEAVDTRRYFSPPVHRQRAYAHLRHDPLPVTDDVASRVVSLPMFPRLAFDTVDRIVQLVRALHESDEARAQASSQAWNMSTVQRA